MLYTVILYQGIFQQNKVCYLLGLENEYFFEKEGGNGLFLVYILAKTEDDTLFSKKFDISCQMYCRDCLTSPCCILDRKYAVTSEDEYVRPPDLVYRN